MPEKQDDNWQLVGGEIPYNKHGTMVYKRFGDGYIHLKGSSDESILVSGHGIEVVDWEFVALARLLCETTDCVVVDKKEFARISELEAELKAAYEPTEVNEVHMKNGEVNVWLEHPVLQRFCKGVAVLFHEHKAQNYVQWGMDVDWKGQNETERFTITVQRSNGITPSEKLAVCEAKLTHTQAALECAKVHIGSVLDMHYEGYDEDINKYMDKYNQEIQAILDGKNGEEE